MTKVIFAICAWSLLVLTCWSVCQTLMAGIKHLRKLHQVPCANCEYFTNDYRLKCTVNPIQACTEEAICCRDFQPKTAHCNARQVRNPKGRLTVEG